MSRGKVVSLARARMDRVVMNCLDGVLGALDACQSPMQIQTVLVMSVIYFCRSMAHVHGLDAGDAAVLTFKRLLDEKWAQLRPKGGS